MKKDIRIENADIVLTGVALSDIYINKDHLLVIGKDIGSSNMKVQTLLNEKTTESLDIGCCVWKTEVTNVDIFTELSKSHSAYKTLSKREYLAVCQLGDIPYSTEMNAEDRLGKLEEGYEKTAQLLKEQDIVLQDVELRFYEFGNVTVTGVFRLRDQSLSIDEYHIISDFAHTFFGSALRTKVSQLVAVYQSVMREVDASTEIDLEMLKVPLGIDMDFDRPLSETVNLKYALDFSIRYHIVYNTELKELEDFVEPFYCVLNGEWELELKKQLKLKKASIYFGWTHSLIVLNDYSGIESIREYETYRFPLEVILTNWGALNSLSKRLEMGRAMFLKEIDDEEGFAFKKKNYTEIADNIREFSFKVKRIMQSLDSYTVSNNPMHYRLIDLQQEVFLENRSVDRINRQLDLVGNLVDELSIREKARVENRFNKVLTMLTMLTVVDISKTIYEVAVSGIESIAWTSSLSGVMLLALLVVYKYEPNRRKRRRRYEED